MFWWIVYGLFTLFQIGFAIFMWRNFPQEVAVNCVGTIVFLVINLVALWVVNE